MLLATLLVVTLLQFFQSKAVFADEGNSGTGTNDPNPPVNPPSWIKLTAVSDPDGTHANLTVTTDVNAENSSSTVSLYRTNDLANAVAQWTSGKVNTSQINRPLTGYSEYVAKVNSLTSNSAAVTNTTDGWSADLSVSADQFSTADASPQLTWTSSKTLTSTTKLFIYDQTEQTRTPTIWWARFSLPPMRLPALQPHTRIMTEETEPQPTLVTQLILPIQRPRALPLTAGRLTTN